MRYRVDTGKNVENCEHILIRVLSISILCLLLSVQSGIAGSGIKSGDVAMPDKTTDDKVLNANYGKVIRETFDLSGAVSITRKDLDGQVRTFLSNNAFRFNIDPDDLALSSSYPAQESGSLSIMKYMQTYKGLPVYSSSVIVALQDDRVVTVKSKYRSGIDISIKPKLNEEDAVAAVEKDLGISINKQILKLHRTFSLEELKGQGLQVSDQKTSVEGISLLVYPRGKDGGVEYRLAYKVELGLIRSPPARWVYLIDANSGEVLEKYDRVVFSTLSGRVTGRIFPEHPGQTRVIRGFQNETLYGTQGSYSSNVFYSGKENNLNNYIVTQNPISLSGASTASIEFKTRFFMQADYDAGFVIVSTDGINFDPVWMYSSNFSAWGNKSIDISSYAGQQIWIGFYYSTDNTIAYDGWYIDDVAVRTNSGIVFSDSVDNLNNWDSNGFSVVPQNIEIYPKLGTTGANGYYGLSGLPSSFTLNAWFKGPFVDTNNISGADSTHRLIITNPSTHSWDWYNDDGSYKKEESNLFYHANRVHDFFIKGSPLDIYSMNYETIANFQFPGTCNAFADGLDIYLFGAGGGCEATSLSSDIIYHEYTHNVVDHIYTSPLPYSGESGALNEGWADYFAATINNNPCMSEGFAGYDCLRYLNNTYRYPEDIVGEVHDDSRIVSGAGWDLRKLVGAGISDKLVINAMKLEPFNFTEYLDDIIIADDNNANRADGTPHLYEICTAFYGNHGIYSPYCDRFYPLNLLKNPGFEKGIVNWVESGTYGVITKDSTRSHSGSWLAWLGGYDNALDQIYQDVAIPSGASNVYVQFWYDIKTQETTTTTVKDKMTVELRRPGDNTLLKSLVNLSNLDRTSSYTKSNKFNMSEFSGQTVRLRFTATTDQSLRTDFFVDDTALIVVDETPPDSVTNLKNKSYGQNYINWTWTDPTDADFYWVMVYIDGVFKKNVTKGIRYYNAAGLLPNTSHRISTRTVDALRNINKTWKNHTAWTKKDTTKPASISSLTNKSYATSYIKWTWKDPKDADFSRVMVYIDGAFKKNVTKGTMYYNATGFTRNTLHRISTHTVDTSGNVNTTWVNHTARTAP